MNTSKYDLAIAYRIYPRVSRNPPIYKDDKYKLAEFCLKSFKESLGSLNVKIWALLDGCPPEYESLFKKYFDQNNLVIMHLNAIGNKATFDLQIKILSEQQDCELIYFAEDDYFYLPNQFKMMIDSFKQNPEVDFISPYDHPDYYYHQLHRYRSDIKVLAYHHWRTIASTTCTFLTSKKNLMKTKKVLKLYTKKNVDDAIIFNILTKKGVVNPVNLFRSLFKRSILVLYFRMWRHGWKDLLFGKRRKLWCPIPAIGTHMESKLLAPAIKWNEFFNQGI
jgi:hypothetical protein